MIINCSTHILKIVLLCFFASGVFADTVKSPSAPEQELFVDRQSGFKLTSSKLQSGEFVGEEGWRMVWPVGDDWVNFFEFAENGITEFVGCAYSSIFNYGSVGKIGTGGTNDNADCYFVKIVEEEIHFYILIIVLVVLLSYAVPVWLCSERET